MFLSTPYNTYKAYSVFKGFGKNIWKERKNFLDQIFAQGRGKVEASLSGAHLTGTVMTDFMTVWSKLIQEVPQDAKIDLLVRIGDITVKV